MAAGTARSALAYKARRLSDRITSGATPPLSVVMLGSSRTIYGLNASLLEPPLTEATGRPVVAFNFGMTGAGPVTTLLTLQRLLAQGVRPNFLLIEVLPPLLSGRPEVAEFHRLNADRLWLGDLPLLERYGAPRLPLREDWWLCESVPAYAHRFAIVSRFVPAYLPWQLRLDWFQAIDDSGWVNSPSAMGPKQRRPEAIERTHKEYSAYLDKFELGSAPCQALREQLELCRREGIRTALVLMPEGSDFQSWYTPAAWQQIETFFEELRREYGVPVINARNWLRDDKFVDSHHLLIPGAAEFTERLGREVLPYVLAGTTSH